MVDLLQQNGHLTETQYVDAKMLSIHFCDKQCFNNSFHINEDNMSDRMSDIKSGHLGHHIWKGGIFAEFLKTTCANG